jgi:OOP family OmpA-OmpF porin
MKPTYISLLFMVVSTALMAQRHDTPWQINAGLNAVDIFPTGKGNIYFPNQGGFFEDFTNTDHWNAGVPSIGVYRTLKENLSFGVNFAFAGVSKIEGTTNRNLRYISSDVQLKYAFLRSKHLSPYARLGAGISSFNNDASISNNITAEKRSAGHWVGSIGLDLLLIDKFGFYVETNFKSAFGDQGIPHFSHSIGFSYGLGVLDRDGDGTPDSEDECIDEPGIASLNGCPDRDGDGIKDSEDQCPDKPGIKEFMGCPDTDMDGIQDKEDDCTEEAGPLENNGCLFQDVDYDGVFDKDDICPDEPGLVEDKGCPVVTQESIQQLNFIGAKIFFQVNNSRLQGAGTNESILEIKKFMETDERIKLIIEGHTSSDGAAAHNLRLSEERAASVRTRLIQLGIAPNRLESVGYGETRPIETNDTAEGRSRNRRVEFKPKN